MAVPTAPIENGSGAGQEGKRFGEWQSILGDVRKRAPLQGLPRQPGLAGLVIEFNAHVARVSVPHPSVRLPHTRSAPSCSAPSCL